MKLLRVGPPGAETPALLDGEGRLRDLSGEIVDLAGEALGDAALTRLAALDPATLPRLPEDSRIGASIGSVGKLVCIGRNYAEHAAETGSAVPSEPMLFAKATSALCGPDDDLPCPAGATKLDYEVELAIVIGRTARNVAEDAAVSHIAGYTLFNDVSERAWQKERGGQFIKGKSHDGFASLGPWFVPREAIDVSALAMRTTVDGELRQDGTTADMIFGPAHLVAYISHFMTLEPGDVIPTGTPAGVAAGMSPPGWLRPGQTVGMEIEGLGTQTRRVVAS